MSTIEHKLPRSSPRIGFIAALAFWLSFTVCVFAFVEDPVGFGFQLTFSPVYAAWFGFSIWLIAFGLLNLKSNCDNTGEAFLSVMSVPAFVTGLIGLFLLIRLFASFRSPVP